MHSTLGRSESSSERRRQISASGSRKSVFYHFLPRTGNQLTPLAARMQIISATDSIILRNLRQKNLGCLSALNVFNQQVNNAQSPLYNMQRTVLFCGAWNHQGLNNSTLVELANLLCFINKISRERATSLSPTGDLPLQRSQSRRLLCI